MSGPGGAYFDVPAFVHGSGQLAEDGNNAGTAAQDGLGGFTPPGASSPHGQAGTFKMATWRGQLAQAPPNINKDSTGNDQAVKGALSDITDIDQQNANLVKGASQDPSMDPDSIDKDAQNEAKDMLDGDKTDQQMEQILEQMMQTAMSAAQQIPQQLQGLVQGLQQGLNQVVQQVSSLAQQAAGAASHAATPAVDAAAGLGDGLGGGAGGGAGTGTVTAGLEEPVTPMTTSPALVQGTGPMAPAAAPASAAGARMPMMPMMPPMHGRQGDKDKQKRNPNIFPEGRLYEPPAGTVQNFGANPEIDAEAPPFGTAKSA